MQTKAATALYDYWTRQRGEQALPLRSSIEPADIAATASFLCSEEAGFVSGQVIYVAGGPKG